MSVVNQVLLLLVPLVAVCYSAVIPSDENQPNSRQKRTLGLLTAGADTVATGLGTAGTMAATAVGIISAIKPLVLLGLGKCKLKYSLCFDEDINETCLLTDALFNWLSKNGYLGGNVGGNLLGNGFGLDGGLSFGAQPIDAASAPVWVEEAPSSAQNGYYPAEAAPVQWRRK